MQRPKPNLLVMVMPLGMLLVIGIGTLIRFSHNLRPLDVVRVSGGGAACGAAMFGLIFVLASRNKA